MRCTLEGWGGPCRDEGTRTRWRLCYSIACFVCFQGQKPRFWCFPTRPRALGLPGAMTWFPRRDPTAWKRLGAPGVSSPEGAGSGLAPASSTIGREAARLRVVVSGRLAWSARRKRSAGAATSRPDGNPGRGLGRRIARSAATFSSRTVCPSRWRAASQSGWELLLLRRPPRRRFVVVRAWQPRGVVARGCAASSRCCRVQSLPPLRPARARPALSVPVSAARTRTWQRACGRCELQNDRWSTWSIDDAWPCRWGIGSLGWVSFGPTQG